MGWVDFVILLDTNNLEQISAVVGSSKTFPRKPYLGSVMYGRPRFCKGKIDLKRR
jgi:hypothetical protein